MSGPSYLAHTDKGAIPKNRILRALPESDRDALLTGAVDTRLPVGHTLARTDDALSSVYLPETGVLSLVSEMTTGHQIAVGAVGAEGVVGLESLFGVSRYPYRVAVLSESTGYRIPAERFIHMVEQSEALRRVMMWHIGYRLTELMVTAACNRIHSHRQRLAGYLLVTTKKARQHSLCVTHDMLAQLVGGPRHAVTVALNELRARGAVTHLRGQLNIISRAVLNGEACECHRLHAGMLRARIPFSL